MLWLPLCGLAIFLAAFTRQAARPMIDPDTLWHVMAGRELLTTWRFAGPDPLAPLSSEPWVYNQWLPEIAAAGLDSVGGLMAVAVAAQVVRTLMVVLLYALARRAGSPAAAVVCAAVAIVGMWGGLGPRPQLVGLLFLVVAVHGWMATARDLRPRWWLVPLGWLWACSHGSWVFGVGVGAVVVTGLALDRRLSRRQCLQLYLVVLLSALAALVTPAGPWLLTSMRAVSAVSPYISEWDPTTLTYGPALLVVGACAAVAVCWARSGRRTPWVQLLLLGLALVCTMLYLRTVAVGAVLVTPLLAGALSSLTPTARSASSRREWLTIVAAAGTSLLVAAAVTPGNATQPGGVPRGLDSTLDRLPRGTVVYNDIWLGGWLLWQHPQLRPTIDTRAEVYGPERLRSYQAADLGRSGWLEDVDRFKPRFALVRAGSVLDQNLRSDGWHVTGQDAGFVLLAIAESSTSS